MREEWKSIENYEGLYEVSNLGRVKSLRRSFVVECKDGRKYIQDIKEKIHKIFLNIYGYPAVGLRKDKKGKTFPVHRLVAQAFCKGNIKGMTIDHLNAVKTDNRACNLEIVTNEENLQRSHSHGSHSKKRGNPLLSKRSLSSEQVAMVKELYFSKHNQVDNPWHKPFSQRWLAKCFKVSQNTIMQIVTGHSCYDRY